MYLPVEGHANFVCFDERDTNSGSRLDTYCVKFLDDHHQRWGLQGRQGHRLPLQQFGKGNLSRRHAHPDAEHGRHLEPACAEPKKTADQHSSRRNQIHTVQDLDICYLFPHNDLTDDSKLSAALVQKYATPTRKNPPHQMQWSMDNFELEVECDNSRGCMLDVEDRKFQSMENRRQAEADASARRQNAPAPQW